MFTFSSTICIFRQNFPLPSTNCQGVWLFIKLLWNDLVLTGRDLGQRQATKAKQLAMSWHNMPTMQKLLDLFSRRHLLSKYSITYISPWVEPSLPPPNIFFETCSHTNVCCCGGRKGKIAVQGYWPACLWTGSSSYHLLPYFCASTKARIWHIVIWPTFPKTD